MDNAQETLLKRGLYRLGTAVTRELASFSGATAEAVDAYLAGRPDLVLPREPDGRWIFRKESKDLIFREIREGIERDPERLHDALKPAYLDRLRSFLSMIEEILDVPRADREDRDPLLVTRMRLTGKALGEMRRLGRDVSPEEARLAACEARHAEEMQSDAAGRPPEVTD